MKTKNKCNMQAQVRAAIKAGDFNTVKQLSVQTDD